MVEQNQTPTVGQDNGVQDHGRSYGHEQMNEQVNRAGKQLNEIREECRNYYGDDQLLVDVTELVNNPHMGRTYHQSFQHGQNTMYEEYTERQHVEVKCYEGDTWYIVHYSAHPEKIVGEAYIVANRQHMDEVLDKWVSQTEERKRELNAEWLGLSP